MVVFIPYYIYKYKVKYNTMASITDHVIKLQELTQKNLDILQALNDSFFTNQNHLSVAIGENQYAIPSFISLENKLNTLTSNFKNLVNSPETGEAIFNFDGNSRAIEVRSYATTPASLTLNPVTNFEVEQNDIFKDFLTPNPYIQFNIQSLPNDITQVMVKKIIPVSDELKSIFDLEINNSKSPSVQYAYKDLYKILSLYTPDVDYIEYDTKLDLPIRKSLGHGTYVIEEIVEDYVDENLINYITIKLRSDLNPTTYMSSLKYRLFDETIERLLKVGDQLVTFEGNAKMEITSVHQNTNTITVKVLNGEFLNLVPSNKSDEQYLVDLNKIRFFSPIDFNEDKYVRVPLEEDKYVFIAIAALNTRMNVQSSWGSGIMLNTHELVNNDIRFDKYYKENVRNVGDVLFEITSLMSNTLTKQSPEEFNRFTNFEPVINLGNLLVVQINKHLNDSTAVKNIRSLYTQKKTLQSQLTETQNELDSLNETLASISFDDTTGRRTAYSSQISSLNAKKNELSTSIAKIVNEISISANNSEVPIENAKYRIRGFFDIENNEWKEHIKGIRVQYRYKNVDAIQNQALTINDKFVFSDWNEMTYMDRTRIPSYNKNAYVSSLSKYEPNVNEPSFNQIDIPISQGETVDIKLKLIYDFGDPFVQTTSKWSQIVNIGFPDEYLKDIKILDIIEENNNDIETNRFNNIIKEEGIPDHVGDRIVDQDVVYYHKPENIASGFYTAERRIIPLKDKLEDLNNLIIQLSDEVNGTSSDSLKVSIKHGTSNTILNPFVDNLIYTESYSALTETGSQYEGNYVIGSMEDGSTKKPGMITTIFNISLTNESDHIIKLYSLFPGDRNTAINRLRNSRKFEKLEYCVNEVSDETQVEQGVYFEHSGDQAATQGGNQYIYFRVQNVHTLDEMYVEGQQAFYDNVLSCDKDYMKFVNNNFTDDNGYNTSLNKTTRTFMYVYPKLTNRFGLCLDSNTIGSHLVIKPKEEIIIPIVVEYFINNSEFATEKKDNIQKTLAFDLLPSLYKDPISYQFTIIAKYENTAQDKVIANQQQSYNSNDVSYNPIYK